MAKFETLIPFIFHFAAGLHGDDLCLPIHLQFEKARKSGWSDDPDDPGGATMIDVTIAAYTTYRKKRGLPPPSPEQLRDITLGEWIEILKTMYWDKWQADSIINQGIANMLVDWVWASGTGTIRKAQAVIGVKADGIAGPVTIAAINNSDTTALFSRLYAARKSHYLNCRGAWKYLNGWLRRLNAIRPDGSFSLP
ncbi:MAG: peptidoglycan domain protein [Muribaculaceae bacterium]|nr:peptidoglycan domain protein [Muribaculaceae bacterium]